MYEAGMQGHSSGEYGANPDDVAAAGIVLFDALARFQAGETESGLECLEQLQKSRSLSALIDALCPGLSSRRDKRSQRIRRLLPDGAESRECYRTSSLPDEGPSLKPRIKELVELTVRQRTVLMHVRDGCSNVEIASRLSISKNTVKWHLKEIFRVLDVENRCSALKVARLRKLI